LYSLTAFFHEGLCGAYYDAALKELLQVSPFTGKASSWADTVP